MKTEAVRLQNDNIKTIHFQSIPQQLIINIQHILLYDTYLAWQSESLFIILIRLVKILLKFKAELKSYRFGTALGGENDDNCEPILKNVREEKKRKTN